MAHQKKRLAHYFLACTHQLWHIAHHKNDVTFADNTSFFQSALHDSVVDVDDNAGDASKGKEDMSLITPMII